MTADDPVEPEAGAPEAGPADPTPKGRRSLSRMRREMTDDELSSSGVQKIMMDDLDRLEAEKIELQRYVDRFHAADRENAVLKEKGKVRVASDITFGVLMTLGAAAIGYSPTLQAVSGASQTLVWTGAALLVGGVLSKLVLR